MRALLNIIFLATSIVRDFLLASCQWGLATAHYTSDPGYEYRNGSNIRGEVPKMEFLHS